MAIKRDKYDKIFSDLVRDAAQFTCQRCGREDSKMELAHNLGRRATWTRYDPRNAACLCTTCHFRIDENAYEKISLFTRLKGQETCELMRQRFSASFKTPKGFKDEIYEHYKNEVKRLKEIRMENYTAPFTVEVPECLK